MFLSFYNVRVSSRIEIEKNKHPGSQKFKFLYKKNACLAYGKAYYLLTRVLNLTRI